MSGPGHAITVRGHFQGEDMQAVFFQPPGQSQRRECLLWSSNPFLLPAIDKNDWQGEPCAEQVELRHFFRVDCGCIFIKILHFPLRYVLPGRPGQRTCQSRSGRCRHSPEARSSPARKPPMPENMSKNLMVDSCVIGWSPFCGLVKCY